MSLFPSPPPSHAVVITARDGEKLPSYLTLPPLPDAPTSQAEDLTRLATPLDLPMVLLVHGEDWMPPAGMNE